MSMNERSKPSVDVHHNKPSVQVRWGEESTSSNKDLQPYAALAMLLQLSEFSRCGRDQNLPPYFNILILHLPGL